MNPPPASPVLIDHTGISMIDEAGGDMPRWAGDSPTARTKRKFKGVLLPRNREHRPVANGCANARPDDRLREIGAARRRSRIALRSPATPD